MKGLWLFNLIIWTVAGIATLSCNDVSKVQYALVWIVLMINLVDRCL